MDVGPTGNGRTAFSDNRIWPATLVTIDLPFDRSASQILFATWVTANLCNVYSDLRDTSTPTIPKQKKGKRTD